jgi:hypothetical protein
MGAKSRVLSHVTIKAKSKKKRAGTGVRGSAGRGKIRADAKGGDKGRPGKRSVTTTTAPSEKGRESVEREKSVLGIAVAGETTARAVGPGAGFGCGVGAREPEGRGAPPPLPAPIATFNI